MSGAGAEVALIDFSPAALALARGFFATAGRAARVVQGDIERLPFASGSFDAVFSAGVLEHFAKPNRLEVLCDMARVLRPGGTLVTLVPNARALLYRAAKRRAERTGQWCWGYEQSLYTLRPEYERAGLRWIREGCLAVSQELSFVRQFITQRPSVLWALDQVLFRVLRPLRCAGYLRGAVGVKK
jgi:SAM-dependent methyltransferase